jgi:hypothetical protein
MRLQTIKLVDHHTRKTIDFIVINTDGYEFAEFSEEIKETVKHLEGEQV